MTKVDIISGFLGAGKTTFIKQLIEQVFTGEKLVLIENEFGEIGIDGGFLKDAGIEITEMNSGCICCTLVGDFSKALQKVLAEYHPDRVLIEPSGVGKLSDIVKAIENVKKDAEIEINGRITVVDGKKAKLYLKNFGEFFEDQVKHASTIVISRTQMMTDEKVEECVHMLRGENADAAIISTPWEELGRDAICRALEHGAEIEEFLEHHGGREHHHDHEECGHGHHHGGHNHNHNHEECGHEGHSHDEECECGHHGHEHGHGHHHHHHADEIFTSWGRETAHKYTDEELDFLLKALSETEGYGTILRSKGIIPMADGTWKQFDLVPEEYEVREGQADYTGRVCVIGTDLKEEELLRLFHI
ncbi:MAG: GTP-binding protein [Lachnospiraceae bacterium]